MMKSLSKPGQRVILVSGNGYYLVVVEDQVRLVLGIECLTCHQTSFSPADIQHRYCAHCNQFFTDGAA